MASSPFKTHLTPARRYDIFESAFEKAVTEAQKRIERLRNSEVVYGVVYSAMNRWDKNNDTKLNLLEDGSILIKISAESGDYLADFLKLTDDIENSINREFGLSLGRSKHVRELFESGQPICEFYNELKFDWKVIVNGSKGKTRVPVIVSVQLPHSGISDVSIVKKTGRSEAYDYTYDVGIRRGYEHRVGTTNEQ